MKKWKYWIEEISTAADKEKLEGQLNELGSGGWEAITVWAERGANPESKHYVLLKQETSN